MHEAMPRYKDDGLNFYYTQEDFMFDLQKRRKWSWNVIRPGGIVGFTPASKSLVLWLLTNEIAETRHVRERNVGGHNAGAIHLDH